MAAKKFSSRMGSFPEFPKGDYAVTLVDFGNNLKKPTQYIKSTFPLPPMAIEHLKFFLPATLIRNISKEAADQIASDLSRTGASVLVRSVGELSVEATAALATKASKRISATTEGKTGIWSRAKKLDTEQHGDISKATNIQFSLLPKQIPDIPGYDMRVIYRSMSEVGGDYYDFIPIDGVENLGIIIADASGHGFSGAMVMTMARSLIRMLALRNPSAKDTMIKFNRFLSKDIKNVMFLTVIYMVLNIQTRTLQITNAGHNPLILLRGGRHQLINPTGMAIGFDHGPLFEKTLKDAIIQLQPNDRIIVYTDGVVEAMNKSNEEFGMDQFLNIVHEYGMKSSGEFLNRLWQKLESWQGRRAPNDDITVLTFQYLGEPEAKVIQKDIKTSALGFETAQVAEYAKPDSPSEYTNNLPEQNVHPPEMDEVQAHENPPGFEAIDFSENEPPVNDSSGAEEENITGFRPIYENPSQIQEAPFFKYEPENNYESYSRDEMQEYTPKELTPFPEDENEAFGVLSPKDEATSESTPEELMETLLETEQHTTPQDAPGSNQSTDLKTQKSKGSEDVVDLDPKTS